MKNFWQWATGDIFTKIGGGIFGGAVVALYYNYLVLKPADPLKLFFPFIVLIIIGIGFIVFGYYQIQKSKNKN